MTTGKPNGILCGSQELTRARTQRSCGNSKLSYVTLAVTQFSAYRIAVSGFGNYSLGAFNLSVSPVAPPAPKPCPGVVGSIPPLANASSISIVVGSTAGLPKVNASMYHPSCQYDIQTSASYMFVPSFSGLYMIDTAGSTYDTELSVFGDLQCATELACNEDTFNFPPQSMVTVAMQANVTYTIVVSAYLGTSGLHTVRVFLASDMALYPPHVNVTVGRIAHGLCYASYCECDPGWTGVGCASIISASPTQSPTATQAYIPPTEAFAFSEAGVLVIAIAVMVGGVCVCAACNYAFPRFQVGDTEEETEGLAGAGESTSVGEPLSRADLRPLQPSSPSPPPPSSYAQSAERPPPEHYAQAAGPSMAGGFLIEDDDDDDEEAKRAHHRVEAEPEEEASEHMQEPPHAGAAAEHQPLPDDDFLFGSSGDAGAKKMSIV